MGRPRASCHACGAASLRAFKLLGQRAAVAVCGACGEVSVLPHGAGDVQRAIDRRGRVYAADEEVFKPQGRHEQAVAEVFTRRLPAAGLDLRSDQRRMAVAVARALARGGVLLADAGVGIGKSYAYLVPILLRGAGVYVVSTSTLVLQDQLARDVARLASLLRVPAPRVIVSKGQEHYACRYRLERKVQGRGGSLPPRVREGLEELLWHLERIHDRVDLARGGAWMDQTLDALDVPPELRPYVRVLRQGDPAGDRSDCEGCPYSNTCGFRAMEATRRDPGRYALLVVNHGLLLHDLDQRLHGRRPLWPTPAGIVVDEAHDLEDKVRATLTRRLNPRRVDVIVELLRRHAPPTADALARLAAAAEALEEAISRAREEYPEPDADRIPVTEQVREAAARLAAAAEQALTRVYLAPDRFATQSEALERAERELGDWVDVATKVARNRQTLGVPSDRALRLRAPSPFDYPRRMLIFASAAFPRVPNTGDDEEEGYVDLFLIPTLRRLLEASQGRALILSTSRRRAWAVYERLRGRISYATLWQDERDAVERFRRDVHSVLVGTGKLFAGIDVPGEALSLVVLDRIPFPVPDDPLYVAKRRFDAARGRGEHESRWAWARTTLAQTAGRLIRAEEDLGVFVILDPRAAPGGRYHHLVRDVLPPGTWVDYLETVRRFFRMGPGSVEPRGPNPEVAAAVRLGRSPRFCRGLGVDALRMLRAEDPHVRVQMVDPAGPAAAGRDADAAVVCAGSPHARAQVEACQAAGLDVAVAALRGGPLLELLETDVGHLCSGRGYPAFDQSLGLRCHWARGGEDELDLAEFVLRRYPGCPAVLVLPDEELAATVHQYLKESGQEMAGVEVLSLAAVAASPATVRRARIVGLLLGGLGQDKPKLLDLARVMSVLTFDGQPRGLLVQGGDHIVEALREALVDPHFGGASPHELLLGRDAAGRVRRA